MRKSLSITAAVLLAASLAPLLASPVLAQAAPAEAGAHYSVRTTLVGTLLDDPAAAAILQQIIPSVVANEMFQTMGRSQTLAAIQQFEPAALTDEVLARIQAEFDKIPAGG
jgi:hypothetical protein